MKVTLKKGWILLSDPESFYLVNSDYSRPTWWWLDLVSFHIFTQFDGENEINKACNNFADTYSVPLVKVYEIKNEILNRFRPILDFSGRKYSPQVFTSDKKLEIDTTRKLRSCAPINLTWVITNDCPLHCIYCYMNANKARPGAVYQPDINIVNELIKESVQLLINEIVITGGEPFLIKNIYQIINAFLSKGIKVRITTKSAVDASKFTKGDSHLLHIEQSIDSLDSGIVKKLNGRKSALTNSILSINSYYTNAIPFSVKSVIGKANLNSIEDLAKFCKMYNARSLQLVEYRDSLGRNVQNFSLSPEQRQDLLIKCNELSESYQIKIEIDLDKGITTFSNTDIIYPGSFCGEGIKTLSFLSDGTVTRCPAIPKDVSITGGNIFRDGIYNTWNYDKKYLKMINPRRKAYKKSICLSCDGFEDCNTSGRCLVNALRFRDRILDVDRNCLQTTI